MIFLFCNQQYGRPFLETAIRFSRKRRVDLTVIFSRKKSRLGSLVSGLLDGMVFKFRHRTPLWTVKDVNSADFLGCIGSDAVGLVAGFNQIFALPAIDKFEILVNFHPSILPLYRGPVPSSWCLRNREQWTGFTLHRITEKIDDGEILYQEAVKIEAGDSASRLDERIGRRASGILWDYLDSVVSGQPWEKRVIDANDYYQSKVYYATFNGSNGKTG